MFKGLFPDPNNAAARLKHQIDTLKVFNENVTELAKDEKYQVDFETGGKSVSLIVNLGPEFPNEKPSIFIYPPVRHPWVAPNGEIFAAPGLVNFSIHSDLGRVVKAIIREFELRPPLNGDISPPQSQPHLDQRPYLNNVINENSFNASNSIVTLPTLALSALRDLTTAQLEELNENSDSLDKFIENLHLNSNIEEKIDELIERNETLARDNINKEPELLQLQEEVSSLFETLKEYKTRYEELSSEYKECCDKYNPHRIIEKIRQSVAEIDEESEQIAEAFLNGEVDLETFLTDYENHRITSHSRKIKDDKLSQQLEKLHQAGY